MKFLIAFPSGGARKQDMKKFLTLSVLIMFAAFAVLTPNLFGDKLQQQNLRGGLKAGVLGTSISEIRFGTAVLGTGGTVIVPEPTTATSSVIMLTCQIPGGTPGFLRVSARSAGQSFTILSSNASDTSTVGYMLVNSAAVAAPTPSATSTATATATATGTATATPTP